MVSYGVWWCNSGYSVVIWFSSVIDVGGGEARRPNCKPIIILIAWCLLILMHALDLDLSLIHNLRITNYWIYFLTPENVASGMNSLQTKTQLVFITDMTVFSALFCVTVLLHTLNLMFMVKFNFYKRPVIEIFHSGEILGVKF